MTRRRSTATASATTGVVWAGVVTPGPASGAGKNTAAHPPMTGVRGHVGAESVDPSSGISIGMVSTRPSDAGVSAGAMAVGECSIDPIESIGAHVDAQTPSANEAEKAKSASSAATTRKRDFMQGKVALWRAGFKSENPRHSVSGVLPFGSGAGGPSSLSTTPFPGCRQLRTA